MVITKDQLLLDLYESYWKARKGKSKKSYVIKFEKNLHNNLLKLRDDLYNRTYMISKSTCFIIDYPKKREIFAAEFVDRIVHHLYFKYTYPLFLSTFIYDSYSCIEKRGTYFGINRLRDHIMSESNNYKEDCFILKLDIKGYFMNINRLKLLKISLNVLDKKFTKYPKLHKILDLDFIYYLTRTIITYDPTLNYKFLGTEKDYEDLPESKSLFYSPLGCGLPIGNLTSQLFSNVYMNVFDQYMKRKLGCKHYGRYVDDSYVVSKDKDWLHDVIKKARLFLKTELELELQEGKIKIYNSKTGVDFLGSYIKPHRLYISNQSFNRVLSSIYEGYDSIVKLRSLESKLSLFTHYKSKSLIKQLYDRI